MQVTTVGLDIAKNVFQIHGVDAKGRAVLRKRLRRSQFTHFFANLPVGVIGMDSARGSPLLRIPVHVNVEDSFGSLARSRPD